MVATLFGKFMVLTAIACLGVMAGVSWSADATGPAPEKNPPVTTGQCKKDADCALVPDDCCSCSAGGAQRAIPKKQKDEQEKQRTKRCAGTMCAQMISRHPSCSARAVCDAGICKLG